MPLFVCDNCGCIENTALSMFWLNNLDLNPKDLCSECDPRIGKWHGKFPKEKFNDEQHRIDSNGFVRFAEEKEKNAAYLTPAGAGRR